MKHETLINHWLGESREKITANWLAPSHPDQFEGVIERERKELTLSILQGVFSRAASGHIDAIEWIESRGLVTLPKPHESDG